jgi:hypothetical protein
MDTDSIAEWSDEVVEEGEEVDSAFAAATCFLSSVALKRPRRDDDDDGDVAACTKKLRGFSCEDGGDFLGLNYSGSFVDELGEFIPDVVIGVPPLPYVPFRPEVDAEAAKAAHTLPRFYEAFNKSDELLLAPLPLDPLLTPAHGYRVSSPRGGDAIGDLLTAAHVDAVHRAMEDAVKADDAFEYAVEVFAVADADRNRMRRMAAKWGLANKAAYDHSVFASKYNTGVLEMSIRNAPPEGLYPDGWEQLWLRTACPSCCGVTPHGEYVYGFMSHCTVSGAPWGADPSTVLHDYEVVILAPWPGKYVETCVA